MRYINYYMMANEQHIWFIWDVQTIGSVVKIKSDGEWIKATIKTIADLYMLLSCSTDIEG